MNFITIVKILQFNILIGKLVDIWKNLNKSMYRIGIVCLEAKDILSCQGKGNNCQTSGKLNEILETERLIVGIQFIDYKELQYLWRSCSAANCIICNNKIY